MNFSEFSKNLYKNLSGLNNQGHFIGALFNAAGSDFFTLKPTYDTDGYQRKVFSGTRDFTQDMKDSFPKPINTEKLMEFFKSRIGEQSLTNIMRNFDIPEGKPQNKDLLTEALCIQFQNIVSEASDDVDDIVASEYTSLLNTSGLEIASNDPFYPGDDLLIISELPNDSRNLHFYELFEHQWTIKNIGTVTWKDRYLEITNKSKTRIRTIEPTLSIPIVKPGETIYLTVQFNSRGFEGTFESILEIKDDVGNICFPDKNKALKFTCIVSNSHKTNKKEAEK